MGSLSHHYHIQEVLGNPWWFSVGICKYKPFAFIDEKFILKNPLQDLLSSLNAEISTQTITGHEIYNLAYTYKFQLKTTQSHFDILEANCWTFRKDIRDRVLNLKDQKNYNCKLIILHGNLTLITSNSSK